MSTPVPSNAATMSASQLLDLVHAQAETITRLEHRLAWFERQLFGAKSERLRVLENAQQLPLSAVLSAEPGAASTPPKTHTVSAHTRTVKPTDVAASGETESVPFFDASRVPVETITLDTAELDGLTAEQYAVIGEKVSYRLAQRPGSYVILKYVRPVVKRLDTATIHTAPAPRGVLEGSRADVSFLAGLLVDKFAWHLPLYRQHQRLAAAGITVSRSWLTQLAQQSIALLEPIYTAQLASIRDSRLIAIDETPIKAGRSDHGKTMHRGYFWPVYGEADEVCFPYFATRGAEAVYRLLGASRDTPTVLLTDGYAAYERYARSIGETLTHARCWAHARRELFEAQAHEPERAREGLEQIAALYAIEERIRKDNLGVEAKHLHRLTHSKPVVEQFFGWIERQFERQGLLPSSPFTKALAYIRDRRTGLEVFLTDPAVPLDTNHLERALRVVPMGKKNWLFCWTELGAQHVGILQSLIVTCRLHRIDPYTYLVDVLQRVDEHRASQVGDLTPRRWKTLFAAAPLTSDLQKIGA